MKRVINDLTGRRFGRLIVLGIDDRGTRKTYYNCFCDCGNTKSIRADSLICGAIRSCGCLKKEQDNINLARDTHRQSKTRLYKIWQGMKKRCENPNNKRYIDYGGRDIKVCEEWHDFTVFYEWAINNGYSENLTIDRINNEDDYKPSNCRWATKKEQANNRRTNVNITIGNTTKTLREWCDIFQVNYQKVEARHIRNKDLTVEELFKE